jgi:uncharacterized repeat protein (TIGR01451 family)
LIIMSKENYKPIAAVMALCAMFAGCCHWPTYAYRARVVGPPVATTPAIPVTPTPAPALADAQPTPAQPWWSGLIPGGTQPSVSQPGGPQPLIPVQPGTSVQANLPTQTPPLVSTGLVLEKVGPSQATVGALVTYRIEVQAASGGARDVTVHDQLAPGLTYASSTPMATVERDQLHWQLGNLRGGELRTIEVSFRAEQAGTFNNCAVARTSDGQTSQDCISTAVVVPDLEVRVRVAGSDTAMVGDRVTFEITVTNRSSLKATGLVISDQFDTGLVHDAAASPIEKDLGELLGGQSTTIGVTFRVAHAGRLCNRVEVRGEAGVRGTAEACVTAMMAAPPGEPSTLRLPPPPAQGSASDSSAAPPASADGRLQTAAKPSVQLKVTGPTEPPHPDAVAEFNIEVKNTGERPLTNLTITASHDEPLKPVQATDGYEWDDRGQLYWKFPTVPAGESRRVQLNCRWQNAPRKACVRAKLSTQEGAAAEDEACVDIRREENGASKLDMKVDDLADPVKEGNDVTYEIRVTNTGTAAARNVALLVIVPKEMSVIRLGTTGGTGYDIDDTNLNQNVRFNPVVEIPAGGKETFRVRVRAMKAGELTAEAVLKSDGMPRPLSVKQKTTVFERGE